MKNSNIKVLLITFVLSDNNYGQRLQAYALQKFLKNKFNADIRILDERSKFRYLQDPSFSKFEDLHMQFIRPASKKDIDIFDPDVVLFGSDQILNPGFGKSLKDYGYGIAMTHDNIMFYASSNKGMHIMQTYMSKYCKIPMQRQHQIIQSNIQVFKKAKLISVRELKTAESFKDITTANQIVNAVCSIDPVFLLSADEWRQIMCKPRFISYDEIFDVEYMLPRCSMPYIAKTDDDVKICKLNAGSSFKNLHVSPAEFLYLIDHCRKIKTRSFHGLAFSLIFNKQKIEMVNDDTDNARISSVIKMLDVDPQMKDINYSKVNENIKQQQQESYKYFMKNYAFSSIYQVKRDSCSGCMACKYICPKNAIDDIHDQLQYRYPNIDKNKCIHCGKCLDVCKSIKRIAQYKMPQSIYICSAKNNEDKNASASGGFVHVISKYFIEHRHGIVYGVQYDKGCKSASFARALTLNEIEKFKSSKYIQTGPVPWNQLLEDIATGKEILFVGLPCQSAALKYLIKEDKPNLTILVLICHGILTPTIQQKILNNLEEKDQSVVKYLNVRYQGAKTYVVMENGRKHVIDDKNNAIAYKMVPSNLRQSCKNCQHKLPYIVADFIVGDPHGILDISKKHNIVFCMNEKSQTIYNSISCNLLSKLHNLQHTIKISCLKNQNLFYHA